jgi:hypothetical protein
VWIIHEGREGMIEWALNQVRWVSSGTIRPLEFSSDDEWVDATPELFRLKEKPSSLDAPYTPPQQRRRRAGVAVE